MKTDWIRLAVVLVPTSVGAYGVWYGTFAKEFTERQALTGRPKRRYKPQVWQRIMVCVGSLIILVAGVAEIRKLWK